MPIQKSDSSVQANSESRPEAVRHTTNYPQINWEEQFLTNHTPDDPETSARRVRETEELKDEVRKDLLTMITQPFLQQLKFIDAVQRLGLGYHFAEEIKEILQHVYLQLEHNVVVVEDDDLYFVALRFRLLREEGFDVSSEMFSKFKGEDGRFQETLISNMLGMLALYEASHLRVHGEDILDEALAFTTAHLESVAENIENPFLAAQVKHALKQAVWKGLSRLEAKHFISIYNEDPSHDKVLLKLAKLDFNLLQSIHRKELSKIIRYWKDLDLTTKLPFARDRAVECFFWSVGIYFEPEYWLGRKILTILVALTTYIDDIYDAYGTLDELQLFTEAIERWDISIKDKLPEYMQVCYHSLLDFFDEIEEELTKEGNSYRVYYGKELMKTLMRAYLQEAKWLNANYIPTMEEHLKVALVSCTYPTLITISFIGMSEIVTKEAFAWMLTNPKIVRASSIICRHMDDIVGHELEQERGHVASGIECYMKQYGVSKEEAVVELNKQIVNAWKDINEELLKCNDVPKPLLVRALNFARVMDVLYKVEDSFTLLRQPILDGITSLFIDPIPI